MTNDPHRQAALAVAVHGPGSPADRRELLDALGLIDSTGRGIVPAPQRQAGIDDLLGPTLNSAIVGERDTGRFQDDKHRPRDLSRVPAGLRAYTPPQEVVAPRRRRSRTPTVA